MQYTFRWLLLAAALSACAPLHSPGSEEGAVGGDPAEFALSVMEATPTNASEDNLTITLDYSPRARRIRPHVLGTNILYWIDEDIAWSKGMSERLRELGVKTLRYPGGEVADNFDWESNRIERQNQYPYEAKTEKQRQKRLDYREFLAHAQALDVENIFFVVNLEGAYLQEGDWSELIPRYANHAARWVGAVREAGYRVAYWEIGNESHLNSAFPLTAREYSRALREFSIAMKAVDPEIQIGAVGPIGVSGSAATGFADAMGPTGLRRYRTLLRQGQRPCQGLTGQRCLELFRVPGEGTAPVPWWDVILDSAWNRFDFVTIHRYHSTSLQQGVVRYLDSTRAADMIQALRQHIEAWKGDVEIALTEWSTPHPAHNIMSEQEHAVETADQLANYLQGGVDYALYWPWRFPNYPFPLVTFAQYEPRLSFEVLRLFQRHLRPTVMSADYPREGLYALATRNRASYGLIIVNKSSTSRRFTIVVPERLSSAKGQEIASSSAHPLPVTLSADRRRITFRADPLSVIGVTMGVSR